MTARNPAPGPGGTWAFLLLASCAGAPAVVMSPAGAVEAIDLEDTGCVATVAVYTDADGDGFGDVSTEASACEIAPGQAGVAGDCDDANADAWPGAVEGCGTVDLDCDGVEAGLCVLAFEDGDATITDGLALVHDITGDGQDDAVGVSSSGGDTYRLWVVPGPVTGGRTVSEADAVASVADVSFYGLPGEYADAGDVTGDGFGDLWVLSPDTLDVTLYPGPWDGKPDPLTTWKGVRSVTMSDMTGDGQVDVWAADTVRERVYLMAGPIDETTPVTDALLVVDDAYQDGSDANAFGGLLLDMGDHDADGVADLLAMDVNYDIFYPVASPTGDLRLYGADQRGEISSDDARVLWPGTLGDFFALGAVPAGDVDQDGFDDLLISGCFHDPTGGALGCLLSGPFAEDGPDWGNATTYSVDRAAGYYSAVGAGAVLPAADGRPYVAWSIIHPSDPSDFYGPQFPAVQILPADADRGTHLLPDEAVLQLDAAENTALMTIPGRDGIGLWQPAGSSGLHDLDGDGGVDLAAGGGDGLQTHGLVLGLDSM